MIDESIRLVNSHRTMTTARAAECCAESVRQWNALYPQGSRVRAYQDVNDELTAFDTITRTEAYALGGVQAVVHVHGISMALPLRHVKPLAGHAETPAHPNRGLHTLQACVAAVLADTLMESGVAA